MLLQKWYVPNFLDKVHTRNDGELPKFFVESSHEPIIDKETFNRVQAEIARRVERYGGYNKSRTPKLFTQLIRCGHCDKNFKFKCYTGNGTKRDLWSCQDYVEIGAEYCPVGAIREDILINLTKDILLQENFIKEDTPLTNDLLKTHIRVVIAKENKELEYHLKNGKVINRNWKYPSRSKSWTPEMRQKARERALAQHAKRKEEQNHA
jgi:hypothetical protein